MLLFVSYWFVCGRKAGEGEGLRLRALRFMSFASPPPLLPYSSVDFWVPKPCLSATNLDLGLT